MRTNFLIIIITGIILAAMFAMPYSSTIIPWKFYFECLQHGWLPSGTRGDVVSCHEFDVKATIESITVNENTANQKCADLFDKILQKMKDAMQHCKDLGVECEPLSEDVLMTDPEFRENNCADTVNDWAYLSENEDIVWESGINWKCVASRN
jgi:hypothetical protein